MVVKIGDYADMNNATFPNELEIVYDTRFIMPTIILEHTEVRAPAASWVRIVQKVRLAIVK